MPIERRRRTYFAYLDVPKDVRATLKRRVYRQTLQTDSLSIAQRRAPPLIARWKSEIARARKEPDHDDAQFWRDALRRAVDEDERSLIWSLMEDHLFQQGLDNTDPEAKRFYATALGAHEATTAHLDEWIASLQVKAKTANMRRATIERLAAKFKYLDDITRKEVRRWLTELLAELKSATVQRMMTDCRIYWSYLAAIEVVPEDSAPFDKLGLKVKRASWKPYQPEEAVTLLKAARDDRQLADLIRLAMYTGARREELCSLKVTDVEAGRIEITDAKTPAGVRTVPLHRRLRRTVARLAKASQDGYLLSGLKANANGSRGDALGKRFTRLKRSLGFSDRHSFHSLRGTVITMLEHAGVPEGTVQDIVGHERSTLTGSIYSGKSTFEMRKLAITKLRFPSP